MSKMAPQPEQEGQRGGQQASAARVAAAARGAASLSSGGRPAGAHALSELSLWLPKDIMLLLRRQSTARWAATAAGFGFGAASYMMQERRAQNDSAPLLMQSAALTPRLFAWGRLVPAGNVEAQVARKTREPADVRFWESKGLRLKQLSFGSNHGAALDDKGGLWAWGTEAGPVPVKVPCKAPLSALASTTTSLYAVTTKGRVVEWRDVDTQLAAAMDTTASLTEPKPLRGDLTRVTAKSIAAGDDHVLVVGSAGEVVAFGDNSRGQLGLGREPADTPRCEEPTLLKTMPAGAQATHAACGAAHSVVALADGGAVAFGDDRNLQLGVRQRTPKAMREGAPMCASPVQITALPPGKRVVGVAAGGGGVEGGHSAFHMRSDDGDEIWTCGYGRFGALGLRRFEHQSEPRPITTLSKLKEWDEQAKRVVGVRIERIASGERHMAALLATGNCFVWGWNDHGQLGTGGGQGSHTPTLVNAPPDLRFAVLKGLSCGPNSVAVFT